ncbi:MAG: flagellar protein FlgN [Deltaproteobacteria bacterium]|nr:flagellar protein FlgN [Deltaproteobacteria bacterium]
MPNVEIATSLEQLHGILLEERRFAQELRMAELTALQERKKELLKVLEGQRGIPEELRELVGQIRFENRRNAYLLWAGLNWVRDMMGVFGRNRQPAVYGRFGHQVVCQPAGALLSGRV